VCAGGQTHINDNANTPPRKYQRHAEASAEAFKRSTMESWMLSGKSARPIAGEPPFVTRAAPGAPDFS